MKNLNIVLVLIFIFSLGFGVLPLRNKVKALETQQEILISEKKKFSDEFKKIQEINPPSSKEKIFNDILIGYDQASFLNDIESIIKKNKFEVKNIQFSLGSNEKVKAEQIQANFKIKGSRGDIYNFLKEVEQNKNFMGITSFSIEKNNQSKENAFEVSLYSFFQKK